MCPWPLVLATENSVTAQPQVLCCPGYCTCLPNPDGQSEHWPLEHISAIGKPLETGNKNERARTLQTRVLPLIKQAYLVFVILWNCTILFLPGCALLVPCKRLSWVTGSVSPPTQTALWTCSASQLLWPPPSLRARGWPLCPLIRMQRACLPRFLLPASSHLQTVCPCQCLRVWRTSQMGTSLMKNWTPSWTPLPKGHHTL